MPPLAPLGAHYVISTPRIQCLPSSWGACCDVTPIRFNGSSPGARRGGNRPSALVLASSDVIDMYRRGFYFVFCSFAAVAAYPA